MLAIEALKYNTRKDFQINSKGAYLSAYRRDILENICSHMKTVRKAWTHELVAQEAMNYTTRTEFQNSSGSAYMYALNNGILNEVCAHMKLSGTISLAEKEIFLLVLSIYKKAKKLRDRSVAIKNKPHISGFDIDVFVPELNKGIEFDGKYYHSFDYMRKDKFKKDWTDKDIKNYHKIKDRYFLSKGISVLHIKEEDWIKDKTACLDKCLNFLKGDVCQ